jgi:hypothetical protein
MYINVVPDRSDYQLLFETCIKDLAFAKEQQWKTVHLTLIALAALFVSVKQEMMCVYLSCFFVVAVTSIGLRFMFQHQSALLRYRRHKERIVKEMPALYKELHQKNQNDNDNDIRFFSYMFMLIMVAFGMFVFGYVIYKGGKSMSEYHRDVARIALMTASYVSIIFGSLGMIVVATKFSFSTKIKDMELTKERFLCFNGYQVWWLSWSLIILGAVIQLIDFWL